MKRKRFGYWLLVPLFLLSLLNLAWRFWPQPRAAFYRIYREQGRERTLDQLVGYEQTSTDRFELYYQESDRDKAELVLDTAEAVYDSVVERMGYRPIGPVPIILYPTRQELRQAFGWGSGESALGVYWQGTIRLLSPNAWLDQENEARQAKAFRKLNPIAHELTHYLLDEMTNGNYPRWFTEGLAQRIEHEVTGFLWLEPSSRLDQPLYALADLQDRFDHLENQPLAYRQSYLVLAYIAQTYGEESIFLLIQRLQSGIPFPRAVEQTLGASLEQVYGDWMDWAEANQERLDEEL